MVMGLFSNELVVCRDALLSVVVQTPLLSSRDFDSVSLNVEPHFETMLLFCDCCDIFFSFSFDASCSAAH